MILVLSPWLILAGPALAPQTWLKRGPVPDLTRALVCYGALFSAALLFWPDSQTRYAMPAVPVVALAVGLAGDRIRRSGWLRWLLYLSLAAAAGYLLALNFIYLPLNQERYTASRRAGAELAAILDKAPGPAFLIALADHHNVMFHLGRPVRELEPGQADRLKGPGWLIVSPRSFKDVADLRADRSDRLVAEVKGRKGRTLLVVRLDPDPSAPPPVEERP